MLRGVMRRLVLAVATMLAGLAAPPTRGAVPSPGEPGAFDLHGGLEISLFAREPDVVDPVALAFDELGRAWVVEMRDYPYGFGPDRTPGSTIRLLEDVDGDGRVDRSTLFAEGLSFATSVTPWHQGILVTAPPEIVFLADTNGDGKADLRETMVSGFRLGVTDSNVNGLRYGLDNWIHGANGGNGGSLRAPRREGATLRLGDRDFRFDPASGRIEPTSHTGGGFGLVFDAWGRSFTTYNINHVQQRVADAAWFDRYPGLPPAETTHSISDHGDMARIYPVSPAVTRPNHPEQAGYFSAAGGLGFIAHPGWPGDLPGSFLVCDVVGNLVHRDVLHPDGPVFRASRAPGDSHREFLASRDNHFRPVGLEPGPDGALYLLDMQRAVIEHPDYIPKKLLETLDLRAGSDRGRIYRIAPKGWKRPRELPGRMPADRLVKSLAAENPWTRITAQRLLVQRRDTTLLPALQELARQSSAVGRLHARWTLDGLQALDTEWLSAALQDPVPELRLNALHHLARNPPHLAALSRSAASLLDDPNAEVRFTAALVAGRLDPPPIPQFARLLRRDHSHAWTRRAVLASLGPRAAALEEDLFGDLSFWSEPTPSHLHLAGDLAETLVSAGTVHLPPSFDRLPSPVRAVVLQGILRGLERRTDSPYPSTPSLAASLAALSTTASEPELAGAALRLGRVLGLPRTEGEDRMLADWKVQSIDTQLPASRRAVVIRLLALGTLTDTAPLLQGLLRGTEPTIVQRAALDVLRDHREPEVGTLLIAAWPSLPPALRPEVVNLLVYRPTFHEPLLQALERETLQVGELNLDLEHRRQLLRKASPDIRKRAAKFMSDEEYSNRRAIVEAWFPKLPSEGETSRGQPVFERLCAQCHRAGGVGFAVGPDLTSLGHRSVEDLLSNILDPNMAMNPAFVAYTAELTDNESETGILISENDRSITLAQAGGRTSEILRSRIRELRSSGRSLMPEGLEAGLTATDLRDLIAFLQSSTQP